MDGQGFAIRNFERQPLRGIDDVMAAIKDEAVNQRDNPPSNDPVISAMWGGVLNALDKDPEVGRFVESYAARQAVIVEPWTVEGVPSSEVNGLLRTVFQFDSMRKGIRFPATDRGWSRQLAGMARDPVRRAVAEMVLSHCHTMTTCGDRFGPFEVIRQLKGETGGFIDGASSIGTGPRQTQLKDKGHPFPIMKIESGDGSEDIMGSQGYANYIRAPVLGGAIVLIDLLQPKSALARMLSLSSHRPSEIMDPGFREERRQILNTPLPNVVFMPGDITDRDSMSKIKEYCEGLDMRVAFVGTALNIVGQENVDRVIDNMLDLLEDHPDSEAFFADFGQVDPRKPDTISLLPKWGGGAEYSYFGVRKHDRGRVNNLFHSTTGSRPTRGRIGDGLLAVRGEVHPIRELIIARAAGSVSVRQQVGCPLT